MRKIKLTYRKPKADVFQVSGKFYDVESGFERHGFTDGLCLVGTTLFKTIISDERQWMVEKLDYRHEK